MRLVRATVCILVLSWAALAQSDRGTITGTVSDPAGAIVANAAIQAKNVGTGGLYDVVSTATGNYTLAELPVGTYEVSVTVPGFKKFVRQSLTLQVAQTLRIDVALEVGTAVVSSTENEFGTVEHVLQIPELDIFDGIAVKTKRGLRFVDRDQITDITTTRGQCALTDEEAAALPAPDGPPVLRPDLDRDEGSSLTARFGRMFGREHWKEIDD